MAEYDDYHFKFKVSIMGEKGVGKSTFLDSTY
jgi:ABC-type lipoprotein export system ATPase subunit